MSLSDDVCDETRSPPILLRAFSTGGRSRWKISNTSDIAGKEKQNNAQEDNAKDRIWVEIILPSIRFAEENV